ncbi:MAG: hypothetical protein ABSF44_16480 [Candidatus Bathyarchaeia archaeon]
MTLNSGSKYLGVVNTVYKLTVILIAIAVIAGVVVYMFTSGTLATMTGGGTAGQEKVAVQSAAAPTDATLSVYYQSTGGPIPTVTGLVVKDSSGNSLETITAITTGATPSGTGALTQLTATANPALTSGTAYTVTLVTKAGGSFVSPSFIAP